MDERLSIPADILLFKLYRKSANSFAARGLQKLATLSFLKALQDGDFATAKKYATEKSQEFLGQLGDMYATMEGMDADKETKEIVVSDEMIDGDKATVSYTEDGSSMELTLLKEGGAWKVAFDKETLMGGAMDSMMGDEEEDEEEYDDYDDYEMEEDMEMDEEMEEEMSEEEDDEM